MHTTMEIKSEECDITEDEISSFDMVPRINPVAVVDIHYEDTMYNTMNNSKTYTPLKTVEFERFRNPRRLSTSLIESSISHTGDSDTKNNGYNRLSLQKLGEKTFGRSHHNVLRSSKKERDVDMSQKKSNLDAVEAVVENGESIKCPETALLDPNILSLPNDYNRNNESDDDIFASQELQNRNGIINNVNVENVSQELTPVKNEIINEKLKDDELFLTPQSIGKRSFSSDSEFDRVCDAIKNNFNSSQYSFETMELLDGFDDLADEANDKILSDVLGLSEDNVQHKDEPLRDPLAQSPQKVTDSKEDDDVSRSHVRTRKRKLPHERRKSARLQKKLTDVSKESDSSEDEFKQMRKKIKQLEERKTLSPTVIEQLQNLDIKLEREPLPQHQLETYLSHPGTLEIKKAFVQYAPLKKGVYSKDEDKIIKRNWTRFCVNHNWDPKNVKPFLIEVIARKLIMNNEQRVKFFQFLAEGLPSRLLYSIRRRFRTIFADNNRRKKFTQEEDEKIWLYLGKAAKYSSKSLDVANLLNRTRSSICNRLVWLRKQLKKRPMKTDVEWSVPLIEKLLKHLLKMTLSKDIYELKDAVIPGVIWVKIERILKIPCNTLMHMWFDRLHAQLFCTRPIYEIDVKIMLIEYMYVKGISNKKELIWPSIARYFDGLTPYYISRIFCTLVRTAPPKRQKNLAGVIGWLYEKKIPQLATSIKDRCLPRLIYKKNGKIEVIEEFPPSSSSSSSIDSSESD